MEQVVGPEVAYCNGPKARTEVTIDLGAYCNETKLHKCERLVDVTLHPSSTTTTTNTTYTTTSTTSTTNDNVDTIKDKYVVISPLFSTFDVDDTTTILDVDSDDE